MEDELRELRGEGGGRVNTIKNYRTELRLFAAYIRRETDSGSFLRKYGESLKDVTIFPH
eukprot:gene50853-55462_t